MAHIIKKKEHEIGTTSWKNCGERDKQKKMYINTWVSTHTIYMHIYGVMPTLLSWANILYAHNEDNNNNNNNKSISSLVYMDTFAGEKDSFFYFL